MKKLDKYLITQFLIALLGSLVFILGLFIINLYIDELKYFSHSNVPISLIFKYILNKIPEFTILALPPAALFSTSYLFGNMNSANEIIALYNGRIGFPRLISPLIILGVMLALLSFLFFEFISADSSKRAFEIRNSIKKLTGKSLGYMYSNYDYFLKGSDDIIYYVKIFDSNNNVMRNPVIFKFNSKGDMVFQLNAQRGIYDSTKKVWKFSNVDIIRYNGKEKYNEEKLSSYSMKLKESPESFMKTPENVMQMRRNDALDFIKEKKKSGANYKRYLVEYHWRYAFSFSAVITILIGSVAGIYFRKAVLVLSFLFAIMMSFGYYGILALGIAYGRSGKLDPIAAAWAGNLIYLTAGIIALKLKK